MKRRLLAPWFATFAPPMPDRAWGSEPDLSDDATRAAHFAAVA